MTNWPKFTNLPLQWAVNHYDQIVELDHSVSFRPVLWTESIDSFKSSKSFFFTNQASLLPSWTLFESLSWFHKAMYGFRKFLLYFYWPFLRKSSDFWNNVRVSFLLLLRLQHFLIILHITKQYEFFFFFSQNSILNWILREIVFFNHCIWFLWVCCFKNQGKSLMEWMLFCRLHFVYNANNSHYITLWSVAICQGFS